MQPIIKIQELLDDHSSITSLTHTRTYTPTRSGGDDWVRVWVGVRVGSDLVG